MCLWAEDVYTQYVVWDVSKKRAFAKYLSRDADRKDNTKWVLSLFSGKGKMAHHLILNVTVN